ncbi:MAG: tetratricopeptide repeat protein, partial [Azonexus sp.]
MSAAALVLALGNVALAAEPDLVSAERLVAEKRYQEVYDLLEPFRESMAGSGNFNYLAGRAALGTQQAAKAQALLTRSLELQPDLVAARLALGRAYFELGMYAEAKIAFETVFRFDNLPPDLVSQVLIYARAAESYLEKGARLVG